MSINIKDDGIVEYRGERDGQTWRTTLAPGDVAEAKKMLSADELAEVQAAWTPAVVKAWRDLQPALEPPRVRPPTVEDRLAAIEDATLRGTAPSRFRLARNMRKVGRLTDAEIDALVASGRLTAEQAAQIKAP